MAARDRRESYAFSTGFLIVHYRGSVKGGRISYKCVHYGETPGPHRKTEQITPDWRLENTPSPFSRAFNLTFDITFHSIDY